jgi:hypothetical protein
MKSIKSILRLIKYIIIYTIISVILLFTYDTNIFNVKDFITDDLAFTISMFGPITLSVIISLIRTIYLYLAKGEVYNASRVLKALLPLLIWSAPSSLNFFQRYSLVSGSENVFYTKDDKRISLLMMASIHFLALVVLSLFCIIGIYGKVSEISSNLILSAIFFAIFCIVDIPVIFYVVVAIKTIIIGQWKRDRAKVEEEIASGKQFALDKKLRRRFLKTPRLLFILFGFVIPIAGAIITFGTPIDKSGIIGYILGFSIVEFIPSLIFFGGYYAVCSGRSFTQDISIKDDKLIYEIYSGTGVEREYTKYKFSKIYDYTVTNRAIYIKGNGKLLKLWVPRTFTNQDDLISFLERKKQEEKAKAK